MSRTEQVLIRLSPEEKEEFKTYAQKLRIGLSEFMRTAAAEKILELEARLERIRMSPETSETKSTHLMEVKVNGLSSENMDFGPDEDLLDLDFEDEDFEL